MKVCVLVASNSPKSQSRTYQYTQELIELFKQNSSKLVFEIISLGDLTIPFYESGNQIFETGHSDQAIQDLDQVKTAILACDHLLITSPVYMHAVSGKMKNLVDHLSHWAHVMRLLGKTSSSIVMASNNGEGHVSYYLKKVLEHFGTIFVAKSELILDMAHERHVLDTYQDALLDHLRRIESVRQERFLLTCLSQQVETFEQYRKRYQDPKRTDFESQYWQSQLLGHASFLEAYLSRRSLVD